MCLLTALLLLVADSGQMLYARTCLKTGQLSFSFSQPENCKHNSEHACCAHKRTAKSTTAFSKAPCCAIEQTLIKQAVSGSYTAQYSEAVPEAALTATAFVIAPAAAVSSPITLQNQGPPLARHSPAFIRVFRI